MNITLDNATVYAGSNLDILPTLPDNSVDSIVTDPPYELGFMGKSWDNSGIAYSVQLWTECMRVLKPGGHLLAFSGSRTYHRMVVAIEDSGFEIRDMISWISNKTFPKSMDISKAIDKGQGQNKARQLQFVNWMRSTNLTAQVCDSILKAAGKISVTSSHSIHYFNEGQPQIATADTFDILKPYLPEVPEEIERLVAERTGIEWTEYKNRQIVGQRLGAQSDSTGKFGGWGNDDGTGKSKFDITAPSTNEAKQWAGWGTGLKPTVEPIVMARKPVEGTVAANVLKFGTGGLNIDASRIATTDETARIPSPVSKDSPAGMGFSPAMGGNGSPLGRWPANIILDPYTAELLDEQSGQSTSRIESPRGTTKTGLFANSEFNKVGTEHNDLGGASRFFYVAKASKKDRNEGLEELESQSIGAKGNDLARTCATCGAGVIDGCECPDRTFVNPERKNFHPTVKPTTLMEYLIKLVTPPNGTVLDPFTGSGSTGKAALLNGFQFIGIELTEEYLPIIEARLIWANEQVRLAAEEKEKETTLF